MKNLTHTLRILLIAVNLCGCKDAEVQPGNHPFVITDEVSELTNAGVTFSARIIPGKGNETIEEYGFIWGTPGNEYTHRFPGGRHPQKQYSIRVGADINANKTYSCKAYVKTESYTVYGNQVSFIALGSGSPPLIFDIVPKSGYDRDIIILKGKYFSYDINKNTVTMNDTQVNLVWSTADSLAFLIPESGFFGEAFVSISVEHARYNVDGVEIVEYKAVTADSKLTVLAPEIISLSAKEGYAGEHLVIYGKDFIKYGTPDIFFNYLTDHQATVLNCTDSQITVLIPSVSAQSGVYSTIKLQSGQKTVRYREQFIIRQP